MDLGQLTEALGIHVGLPSPEELQRLLAELEIHLFTQQPELDERLLDAAWYLQSVATVQPDLPFERRRRAHQVSAHIFDLALQTATLSETETLRYTFAAQVGYLGGELIPNAAALIRRLPPITPQDAWSKNGTVSLEAGILLLGLNRGALYPLLQNRLRQLRQLGNQFGDLSSTAYAAVDHVVRGVWDLTNYLTYGRNDLLERAMQLLQAAVATEAAAQDVDSRWVAAHLLQLGDGLRTNSVWSVLPPNLAGAARAMTLGDPPVLLLWPPQLSFLDADDHGFSPLSPAAKRLVLSFPTSAGKSLLAQILTITHLVSTNGDVCVTAPTRSLCRELASGIERRLRTLGYQLFEDGPLGLFESKPPAARVVVMTPEKLAARLRSDPAGLLGQFSMFVFDEAHLVADGERGWRLEETISLLHHLTRDSEHRILILSAALGNQAHVVSWIDDGNGIGKHSDWRGPRRLNVVFTTRPDWDAESLEPAIGQRQPRRHVPLKGVLSLKTPSNGSGLVHGTFTEPVGKLVLRQARTGRWKRDTDSTTRERDQLVPLILHVCRSGPVLVVEATRTEAQRLAESVAEGLDDDQSGSFALVDVVRSRLGSNHPLARVLAKRVAFHHSALPVDIQIEIEDAVRNGRIRCLVATTTLTEGVNLPFKTVIVAHRDYQGPEGPVQLVDAPRLLNAIGRAGRAGRETEGWLILAAYRNFDSSMFDDLERTGADIELRSTLATEAAIEALARFEASARAGEDAILSNSDAITDGFIRYIWFVADALEELHQTVASQAVRAAVADTLAWHQLDQDGKDQLLRAADIAVEAFVLETPERRRRWARCGTSLASAAVLDRVAEDAFKECLEQTTPLDFLQALDLVVANGRLETILTLHENKRRGFKSRRNAPRDELVEVEIGNLLRAWLSGIELQKLADDYLAAVEDADYRYEQLAEFSGTVLEYHLPWAFGIVIGWVNQRLAEMDHPFRLPDELPGAVQFGVGTKDALTLMLGGIRSRRLANRVAEWRSATAPPNDERALREWLAGHDIAIWRQELDASSTELLDLLAYVRAPGTRLISEVLEGDGYKLPFVSIAPPAAGSEAIIRQDNTQLHPAPFAVVVDGAVVGVIPPEHYADVAALTNIGVPLSIHVEMQADGQLQLDLRLADEPG